jgi:site-specific recombinase XerD
MTSGREDNERVFLSRVAKPLTRFGVHDIVTRHARAAATSVPEMQKKKIGPHTIRHYIPIPTMSGNAAETAVFLATSCTI